MSDDIDFNTDTSTLCAKGIQEYHAEVDHIQRGANNTLSTW